MLYYVDTLRVSALVKVARLVRMDLISGAARVVFSVPRLGLFKRIDLGVRNDGTLVLVGQLGGDLYTAFQLRAGATGSPQWTGVLLARGAIANPPITTDDGLKLPFYASDTRVTWTSLEREAFAGGGSCSAM